jgi:hypothetical protein
VERVAGSGEAACRADGEMKVDPGRQAGFASRPVRGQKKELSRKDQAVPAKGLEPKYSKHFAN